jgi:hypothetical protein
MEDILLQEATDSILCKTQMEEDLINWASIMTMLEDIILKSTDTYLEDGNCCRSILMIKLS